ncbi:MAG: hypothetical protein ACRDD8_16340 [Bacteroidales bacterium]
MKKLIIGLFLVSAIAFGSQYGTKILTIESMSDNTSIEKMINKEIAGLDIVSVEVMPIGNIGKMRVVIVYRTKK